ncbi:MAG: pyridoxine 5'-phosphate synthase [Candidatus Omnitrophica bacterium]|nr:pyridoxine 5'-phosphate synthase [Candidatus Omnitrophota bacterium]
MKLGVNIDHIATVRQARGGREPDPVQAALLCESSGADSIVAHLREDRRHIQDDDVQRLRERLGVRFNLEMSIAPEVMRVAQKIRPDQATLVPEKRRELTTEGGLAVARHEKKIGLAVKRLRKKGIVVSLFIEPDQRNIHAARRIGAEFVEFHTGGYALAATKGLRDRKLEELREGVFYARSLRLGVNAGHGLNYLNVRPIAQIKEIEELNIGHAIISRAVLVGISQAVREMKALITNPLSP